jgi:hypothetical protein
MALSDFRELVLEVGNDNVLVNPINQEEYFNSMVVSSKFSPEEASPQERLDALMAFVKFLYDLIDELEGFLIAVGHLGDKVAQ